MRAVDGADAVRARGVNPSELRDRGLAGADGLVEAVAIVAGRPDTAR